MIPQAFVCQKNCGYSGVYEDVAEHETSCKGIEYTCSCGVKGTYEEVRECSAS